jgi:hypothetical protein
MGKLIIFENRRYSKVNEGGFSDWALSFDGALRCLASMAGTGLEDDDVPMKHVIRCVNKHYVCVPIYRRRDGDLFGNGEVDENDDECDGLIYCPVKDLSNEGIDRDQAQLNLVDEISTFGQWIIGDVYGFVIEDENGEQVESCWGIYGQDEAIKEANSTAKSILYVPNEF